MSYKRPDEGTPSMNLIELGRAYLERYHAKQLHS